MSMGLSATSQSETRAAVTTERRVMTSRSDGKIRRREGTDSLPSYGRLSPYARHTVEGQVLSEADISTRQGSQSVVRPTTNEVLSY